MTSWLISSSELCYTLVIGACHMLIYSTLVICVGLLVNHRASSVSPVVHDSWEELSIPVDSGLLPDTFSINLAMLYGSLSASWLLGSLCLLVRLNTAFVQTRKLRTHTTSAPEAVKRLCCQLARKIGVRSPAVLISRNIPSPVLVGIRTPAILLPANFSDQTNAHVLTHELAHLQRKDSTWNLVSRLIVSLYFFQPLLWILIRHLEETSEEVCDGFVLFYTGERTSYARRLVAMAEELGYCAPARLVGIGIIGLKSSLGRRVQRILDAGGDCPIRTSKRTQASIHSVGVAAILLLSLLGIRSAGSGHRARWQSFETSDAS